MHRYCTQNEQWMGKDGCEGQGRAITTTVGTKYETLMTAAHILLAGKAENVYKFW